MKLNKVFTFLFFSISSILIAQDINTTEINVVKDFKPTIPDAIRLNENAMFADTIKKDRKQTYNIMNFSLKSDYKTQMLIPAMVKPEKISKLYSNRINFGLGYRVGTNANIIHNSTRSKDFSYGIMFKHNNNNNKINDKNAGLSDNSMNIYVKKIYPNNILITNLDYCRKTSFSYGHALTLIDENVLQSRYSFTKLSFNSKSRGMSEGLKHNTNFFISDFNEMSENRIHFSSVFDKKVKGFPVTFEMSFDNYLNYNSQQKLSNLKSKSVQMIAFMPNINFRKYGVDFNFGLGLDYASEVGFDPFPRIIGTKELVKDILIFSFGVQDDKYRNTYKVLSDINPYIHTLSTNQSIIERDTLLDLRTTEAKEIFFNLCNSLGYNDIWSATITYGFVENLPYFDNNFNSAYNRFLVYYLDLWQLKLSSSYSREISQILDFNINAEYYNWGSAKISHMPNLVIDASFPINLRDKIICIPELKYFGSETAFIRHDYVLSSRMLLDLSFQYNYSSNLSISLSLRNLTNSQKELWRDYKEIGFSGNMSVIYSF